jgi:hypothetical protein
MAIQTVELRGEGYVIIPERDFLEIQRNQLASQNPEALLPFIVQSRFREVVPLRVVGNPASELLIQDRRWRAWTALAEDWVRAVSTKVLGGKESSMGAWGVRAFDNDTAGDWAGRLAHVNGLAHIGSALFALEESGNVLADQDILSKAVAACETLARLQGNAGYRNAYTKSVDDWVAAQTLKPPKELMMRGTDAMDRILASLSRKGRSSGEQDHIDAWRRSLEDLRERLGTENVGKSLSASLPAPSSTP